MPLSTRWQSLFHGASDPLFLINVQRRLLAINPACLKLLGVAAPTARGMVCKRRRDALPGSPEAIFGVLSPPAEALANHPARLRRPVTTIDGTRIECDVDFLPLHDAKGRLRILGKLVPVEPSAPSIVASLPEQLVSLRQAVAARYRLDALDSSLPEMERVGAQARLASGTRVPVLLVGEAGTGKQWLARAIHYRSPGADRPFAVLDAQRLSPALLVDAWNTLLSHRRLGTIYLREPALLPRDLQARLVDWLGEDDATRPRLLAGSRRDPREEIAAGRWLEDLHAALATLVIALPPLRDRADDWPALVDRLLLRAAEDDRHVVGLTPAAWEVLRGHRWPGNLRELFHVLATAWRHATGERIDAADLPAHLRQAVNLARIPEREAERPVHLKDLLAQAERRLIVLALRMARGNKSRAAELLSIYRPLLGRRMEALGIGDTEYH